MWGLHGHKTQQAPIASGDSISTWVKVQGWNHVSIEMPSFATLLATTTCNVKVYGAAVSTDTFRVIKDEGNYSAGAGIYDWEIPSTTGGWNTVCRPAARFDFIKVWISTDATDGITAIVHTHD